MCWELDLLEDADPEVRLRSALDLGRRRAAEVLVERLGLEREFFVREALTCAVLRIVDDATPLLHFALRHLRDTHQVALLGARGRRDSRYQLLPKPLTDEGTAGPHARV